MRTETHYGVVIINKTTGQLAVTDYRLDEVSASRNVEECADDLPIVAYLATRKVQVGVWRYASTGCPVPEVSNQ